MYNFGDRPICGSNLYVSYGSNATCDIYIPTSGTSEQKMVKEETKENISRRIAKLKTRAGHSKRSALELLALNDQMRRMSKGM